MDDRATGELSPMLECSLDTLGAFALRVDGRPVMAPSTQKARAILVYLAMHRDADVARERLLELFWPDVDPDRARDSLRTALYSIRRGLRDAETEPDAVLVATKAVVRWTPQTVVDAERFVELIGRDARDALAEALALYRGDFLEGDYDNWTVVERERLASEYEKALARALAHEHQPAIANKLLERNPYEETAYVALIEDALREGRPLAAAQAFRQCRAALAEIGAEPSPGFVQRFGHLELAAPVSPMQSPQLAYVGREAALADLSHFISSGSGNAVVVVSGEPGVGKSTFLKHAEDVALASGFRALRIEFLANDPRPFGAWGPLFESLVDRPFNEFIKSTSGNPVHAIVPVLLETLRAPTVLLADDAQYLNEDSLVLLAAFSRLATRAGHAVVIATRPEGRARLDAELGDAGRHEIPLTRLTGAQLCDALEAAGFVEGQSLASVLFERTDGNPMFIESLLDSFVKNGTLRREGRRWLFSETLPSEALLPRTLARSIDTRLRSRGARTAAVACALALEPAATADDVQAVLDFDEVQVLDALDDLLSLGIVDQPSSGPMFAFTHDLVRERAGVLLNVARRVRMHRTFAKRLEGATVPGAALRRARHLDAAHDYLAAAEGYREAAIQAMELGATQESLDRTLRGIEVLKLVEAAPAVALIASRLYEVMARTLRRANRYEDAAVRAADAAHQARLSGDLEQLARALLRCASIQTDLGTVSSSAEVGEALTIAASLGDDFLRAHAYADSALGYLWLSRERETIEAAQAGFDAAKRAGDKRLIVAAADPLARAHAAWWHFSEALEVLRAMREAATTAGWMVMLNCSAWSAHLHYFMRDFEAGRKEIALARALTAQSPIVRSEDSDLGIPAIYYLVDGFAALLAIERREYETALSYASIAQRYPTPITFYVNYATMVPIDALLMRDAPGDRERAHALLADLSERYYGPWVCSHLVPNALRARVAARRREGGAAAMVSDALDETERAAALCPGDCYRAFDRLAIAAGDAGDAELAARAINLRDDYLRKHAAATAQFARNRASVVGP